MMAPTTKNYPMTTNIPISVPTTLRKSHPVTNLARNSDESTKPEASVTQPELDEYFRPARSGQTTVPAANINALPECRTRCGRSYWRICYNCPKAISENF
uniref:(northern house mosquito) hypothetical protein n=1 Tax=Culex pipiens TaxID=7175 RepID=A0A8D8BF43_CULPI